MARDFGPGNGLNPLLLIEVSIPRRDSMLGVSSLALTMILIFDFGIVPMVWYFFFFSFYNSLSYLNSNALYVDLIDTD